MLWLALEKEVLLLRLALCAFCNAPYIRQRISNFLAQPSMKDTTILITGAGGQIGSVLTQELRAAYGPDRVIASDLRELTDQDGPAEVLDAMDAHRMAYLIDQYKVTQIYHLAAILSATGEKDPMRAWQINMRSFFNVLEIAREKELDRVYFPSSIAVFGKEASTVDTPQNEVLIPETVYGISKVAGENWSNYYHSRYGLDVRSVRYPGIIGYQSMPGGGTTDYAVDIYHHAVANKPFECFLSENTALPMMYMDDAIRGTIELMEAPADKLTVRTSYNLAGMSFSPAEVAASIKREIPDFEIQYKPDFRQAIADSWPSSIDDSRARADWGWKPAFDLDAMTKDMIEHLR